MPCVITITGPSRAGKSTTVDYLLGCADQNFRPVSVPKCTTRPPRNDDRDKEVICVKDIPPECDLIYEQYKARYGLKLSTISELIANGKSPIVILNDVRAVEDVRSSFGESVRSIFIFRESPSPKQYRSRQYRELAKSRGAEAAKLRFDKAKTIYRIYIENIHLFDHVIVNGGAFEELDWQVKQIVKGLKQDLELVPARQGDDVVSAQRLFVIVGTPGSGKDLLIRAVNDMGGQHAQIVRKHTSRARRKDDGKEMICPGDAGYDLNGCDIKYENYGDRYGIKSDQVREGLRNGYFQVVAVSDLRAIGDLQKTFGESMVLIYVHSEMDAKEYQHKEAKHGDDTDYVKRRVEEYSLAHRLYLGNFLAFNHVLIYAGLPEDLYDQMFRLFRAYERSDLSCTTAKSIASGIIWTGGMTGPGKEPRIIGE